MRALRDGRCLLGFISACACRSEPEPQLVTEVRSLAVAPIERTAPMAPVRSAASVPLMPAESAPEARCAEVERQARELRASLPRQLDVDTRATGATAHGCDLTLTYELSTLTAREVAPGGIGAMRQRVARQLCSDRGALAVMQRGGTFSNVYHDRVQAPIGRFTVAAEDCESTD